MWLGGGRETAVGAGGDGDMGRGDDEGDEDNGAAVYRQWLGGGRPAAARPDDEPVRDGGGGGGGGGDWVCACGASRNGDELAQSVGAANRAYSHGRALLDGADGGDDDGADLGRALVLLRQAHSIYRQILHPVNWRRAKCAEDLLALLLAVGDFEQALPVAMETLSSIEAGLDPGPGPSSGPSSAIARAATSPTAPTSPSSPSTPTSTAAASPVLAIRQLLVAKLLWWLYEGELEAPRGDHRATRASSAKGAALLREARTQLTHARVSLAVTHGEESAMYAQLMELHDRAGGERC